MNSSRERITLFVLISILLHLLLLPLFLYVQSYLQSDLTNRKEEVIPVTLVDNNENLQIADIEPPAKEEKPDKAKFAGLYDSRVDEEQVAATPLHPGQKKSKAAKPADQKKKQETKQAATKPAGEGDSALESLPEDFYPDYKVGGHTYLNVLRFPKIGYFVRLKKIFRTTFNPAPSIRSSLSSNQVSSGQVEVTLAVGVDVRGNLAELTVIRSSGLPLYDEEAIRTIRDSSPFAAPPSELLKEDSKLRMVWTFTVYL